MLQFSYTFNIISVAQFILLRPTSRRIEWHLMTYMFTTQTIHLLPFLHPKIRNYRLARSLAKFYSFSKVELNINDLTKLVFFLLVFIISFVVNDYKTCFIILFQNVREQVPLCIVTENYLPWHHSSILDLNSKWRIKE